MRTMGRSIAHGSGPRRCLTPCCYVCACSFVLFMCCPLLFVFLPQHLPRYNEHVKDTRLKMEKDSHQGKLTVAQELNIKQKSTKAYWNIAKREIDLEKQAEKIMTYKDAFAKIKKATGIASIAEMVEEFVRSEDQNFALFNQINNLHREIETLEVANSKMRGQVEKFKSQGNSSEMNKNKIFMTLQGQIERADAKQNIYTERYNEAVQIINLLKPNLLALFREAGCDQGSGAIGQSLLVQGPTDTNLLQFLGRCSSSFCFDFLYRLFVPMQINQDRVGTCTCTNACWACYCWCDGVLFNIKEPRITLGDSYSCFVFFVSSSMYFRSD